MVHIHTQNFSRHNGLLNKGIGGDPRAYLFVVFSMGKDKATANVQGPDTTENTV